MPARVAAINRGELPFHEPGLGEILAEQVAGGRLAATSDNGSAVAPSDVTFITVGTPFVSGSIDLSQVADAAGQIGRALSHSTAYHVVVVKSTVIPGTTDTLVRETLERTSGLRAGEFGLCMNPEFFREGALVEDLMNPDRIVIGQLDERSGQALAALYSGADCPKIFTSLRNAELIKYASNSLLATLVSFSNEIASFCEVTPGTDVRSVMEGLHLDHRLSPRLNGVRVSPAVLSYLRAGCGFGGSCFPKDVNALRAHGQARGLKTHLLDAVMAVNERRPREFVAMAEKVLGPLAGLNIAVLGLAFKPGTSDMRESPALAVIAALHEKGALVRAYDPVARESATGFLDARVELGESLECTLKGADAALLVTAWPEFARCDWKTLTSAMRRPVVIDGRNALASVSWPSGVTYLGIGQMPVATYRTAG
jgi:UDPglucose 6-dehydrogenase/GDP-mannose 6-dehydrogenase